MNLQILWDFRQFLRIGRSDYRRGRYTQKPCHLRTRISHLPHRSPSGERKSSRSVSFLNIFVPAILRPITWCNVPGHRVLAVSAKSISRQFIRICQIYSDRTSPIPHSILTPPKSEVLSIYSIIRPPPINLRLVRSAPRAVWYPLPAHTHTLRCPMQHLGDGRYRVCLYCNGCRDQQHGL